MVLEEKFSVERDKELLQALRDEAESKQKREALADALGIAEDGLLDQLEALEVCVETMAAISLIFLIAVAWADGNLDVKERRAVLDAAERKGMDSEHAGHRLVGCWLARKPDDGLLAVWKDYVAALSQTLSQ